MRATASQLREAQHGSPVGSDLAVEPVHRGKDPRLALAHVALELRNFQVQGIVLPHHCRRSTLLSGCLPVGGVQRLSRRQQPGPRSVQIQLGRHLPNKRE